MATIHRLDSHADSEHDEGQSYPCVQGLIAANVALMTAYASPDPQSPDSPQAQRLLLARKVVSNLFFLREHPLLSPDLRQVMASAHQLWAQLARGCLASDGSDWTRATGSTAH